jgi:twitching motility protein PilT
MQTFDQCLTDLYLNGDVTFESARGAASNPSDFELKLKMFSQLSESGGAGHIPSPGQPPAVESPPEAPQMDGLQLQSGGLDFL